MRPPSLAVVNYNDRRCADRSHHYWSRLHINDGGVVLLAMFYLTMHLTPGAPRTKTGHHNVFAERSLQRAEEECAA